MSHALKCDKHRRRAFRQRKCRPCNQTIRRTHTADKHIRQHLTPGKERLISYSPAKKCSAYACHLASKRRRACHKAKASPPPPPDRIAHAAYQLRQLTRRPSRRWRRLRRARPTSHDYAHAFLMSLAQAITEKQPKRAAPEVTHMTKRTTLLAIGANSRNMKTPKHAIITPAQSLIELLNATGKRSLSVSFFFS